MCHHVLSIQLELDIEAACFVSQVIKNHQTSSKMEKCFCGQLFWSLLKTLSCTYIYGKWCRWCWFMIAITCWLSSGHQCIVPPSCDLHLFFVSWTRTFGARTWSIYVNMNLTSGLDMWRLRKHFWGNPLKHNLGSKSAEASSCQQFQKMSCSVWSRACVTSSLFGLFRLFA